MRPISPFRRPSTRHAPALAALAVAAGLLAPSAGRAQLGSNPFELSTLSGPDGFRVDGLAAFDFLGTDAAYAGDLNGDGLGDVIMGAPYADPNGAGSGQAYVVFGSAAMGTGTSADPLDGSGNFDLAGLNGANGFSILGASPGHATGGAVAGDFDIDGDGFDDIMVGSRNVTRSGRTNAGRTTVIFGNPEFGLGTPGDPLNGFSLMSAAAVSGSRGFQIDGAYSGDRSGFSLDGAGDINGDGTDDIVIGSFFADTTNVDAGRAWVVFGSTEIGTGSPGDPLTGGRFDLRNVDGDNGFVIDGIDPLDGAGFSVSRAGDVNGDGVDDLLIGTYLADGSGNNRGEAYVIFGTTEFGTGSAGDPLAGGSTFALAGLDGTNGFVVDGVRDADAMGRSVAAIGDFDDDGIADFAIGGPEADNTGVVGQREGYAYVVYGNADFGTGVAADPLSGGRFNPNSFNGIHGFAVSGIDAIDRTGFAVAGGADIDDDGIPDLIVGAPLDDANGVSSGASYLIYGTSAVFSGGDFDPATLNGTNGAEIRGENGAPSGGDESGSVLSMGGDINGDGAPDIVIGSRTASIGTGREGRVHVLFSPPPADLVAPSVLRVATNSSDGAYRATEQIEVRLVFDESVLVDTSGGTPTLDLNTGATATWFAGSGTAVQRFLYTVGPTENVADLDALAYNANGGIMEDLVGNAAVTTLPAGPDSLAGGHDIEIDTVAPGIARFESDTAPGTYGFEAMIDAKMVFTEPMVFSSVFGTPFLALNSGGTAFYAGGAGTDTLTFDYEVMAGEIAADLDVVSFDDDGRGPTDLAGNPAILTLPGPPDTLADNEDIAIDAVGPSITSIDSATADGFYKVGASIAVTVEFDKDLVIDTMFGFPRLAMDTGGIATTTLFPDARTIEFVYTVQTGHNSADLDATAFNPNGATILDASGNPASTALPGFADTLAGRKDIVVDTTAPEIASITSPNANGGYGLGAAIDIDVLFTESVVYDTGSGTPRLDLNSGGQADYASSPSPGTGRYGYTVGAGDFASDLDVTAFDLAGGGIADPAGNALVVALPGGGDSLAGSKDISIDAGLPRIVSFTSATPDGFYKSGGSIQVAANFSKPVSYSGNAPSLALDSGGTAAYSSGNGGSQFLFQYSVLPGQNTTDLDVASFDANGGTIEDGSSNALDTSLPGAPDRLRDAKDIVVDTVAPSLVSATTATPDGSYGAASPIGVSLNLSETVVVDTGSGTPSASLDSGGMAVWNGAAPQSLLLDYTVMAGENSADLDFVSLALNGATVRDQAGNDLDTTPPASPNTLAELHDIVVDTIAPRIAAFTSVPATEDYGPGESLTIDLAFTETVVASIVTSPTLSLNSGGTATWASMPAGDAAAFGYTVGGGENASDLNVASVSLFDSAIADAAGNALDATLPVGANSLAGGQNIVVDTTRPAPSVSSTDVVHGDTIAGPPAQSFTVAFADATAVAGFDPQNAGDLFVTNATVGSALQSGNAWTFDVTPVSDGAVQLQVLDGAATDNVGNASTVSAAFDYTFDTSVPSGVLLSPDVTSGGATNSPTPYDFTARFFSPLAMSGFDSQDAGDLLLTNATATAATQSGNDWDFTITPAADGPVSLRILAGAAEDSLARGNPASPLFTFVHDTTAPAASLSSGDVANGTATNAPASFSADFADATTVSGFDPEDPGDLVATNATVSVLRKGTVGTAFTVTPVADGPVTVQVLANAATDQAGNASTASPLFQFDYDATPPTVALSSAISDGGYANTLDATVVTAAFADALAVGGFDPQDIADAEFVNATAGPAAAGGFNEFLFDVAPAAEGLVSVRLLAGAASDAAGNLSLPSLLYSFTIDVTDPVPSFSSPDATDGELCVCLSPIELTLSVADLTDVDAAFDPFADLVLTNASLDSAVRTGNSWSLEIVPTAPGPVSVSAPTGVLSDSAGNANTAAASFSFTWQDPFSSVSEWALY